MVGYVLCQNDKGELSVTYAMISDFLTKKLNITVSIQTVRNYCEANFQSLQKAKVRASVEAASLSNLVGVSLTFVSELELHKFYDSKLENICSWDATFTKHKSRTMRTVAMRGGYDFLS